MRDISLGVVVVAFESGAEIVDCAETLLASAAAAGVTLRLVVVDNGSRDDTVSRLRRWADGSEPWRSELELPFAVEPVPKPLALAEGDAEMPADGEAGVTVLHAGFNRGFAGGVNVGLRHLAAIPGIRHFWVLNPDSMVPPEAMTALAAYLPGAGEYGLAGGRVTYLSPPDTIQIDGGVVDRRTGVTGNLNLGRPHEATPMPGPEAFSFVCGASMIASRAFYEAVGPMREDYFLYYEEVDWAMRRGSLPLAVCPGLRVYHRAGTAIGSPRLDRPASPFSLYFKHRARIRFVRRFLPRSLATAQLYSMAYAARLVARDRAPAEARAVIAGAFGRAPPRSVTERITGPAAAVAFAPMTED